METEGKSAIVPPPPPPPPATVVANTATAAEPIKAKETQTPPMAKEPRINRPGIKPVSSINDRMARPGVRVVEESPPEPAPVEKAHEAVQPMSAPPVSDSAPKHPDVCLRTGGKHGDRVPLPGDDVWMWMKQDGRLVPFPAKLIWFHDVRKRWGLNIFKIGHIQGRHEVSFSEVPADCCWTWPLPRPEA